MELKHLLQLVSELPQNTKLNYVRGTDECKFIDVDIQGERINSETPTGEPKSWAPSYLSELALKILENEPFNLSGLLNNKGSYRPVLETIIAHTREFYTVRKGTATALVWIPSKPKSSLDLEEIQSNDIPTPLPHPNGIHKVDKKQLSAELKKGFIVYFTNYLRLSTGKCDENKIDTYLHLYERNVEAPLKENFNTFNSIFDFGNSADLNNFLFKAKDVLPEMEILLHDKWPKEKEKQTLYYEVWTMIRHYKVFLDMLKSLNKLVISISPTPREMDKSEMAKIQTSDKAYLRAMRTKPFLLLAGISGTGKSRIVKQMAFDSCPDDISLRNDKTTPGNYCLIEVKPNWHDSSELMGYASQIGKPHYVVTPFVRFLAKAMLYEEQRIPFFVCLDEMNLAPVEQYFAEFLSVLESRKIVDGKITSEALIPASTFKSFDMELAADIFDIQKTSASYPGISSSMKSVPLSKIETEVFERLKQDGLRIPSNLIVIGTVNMDETTHQFSRKVIDRAMTIEMNLPEGEPFLEFFNKARDLEYTDNPTSPELYLPTLVKAADVVDELENEDTQRTSDLKIKVATILTELNNSLDKTPFKIAYRVQNELMLYFHELWMEDKNRDWDEILRDTVDQILMMKVLPRIEGDEDLLEEPLTKLAEFCAMGNYSNASKKVNEMQERLNGAHFTSFWP